MGKVMDAWKFLEREEVANTVLAAGLGVLLTALTVSVDVIYGDDFNFIHHVMVLVTIVAVVKISDTGRGAATHDLDEALNGLSREEVLAAAQAKETPPKLAEFMLRQLRLRQ